MPRQRRVVTDLGEYLCRESVTVGGRPRQVEDGILDLDGVKYWVFDGAGRDTRNVYVHPDFIERLNGERETRVHNVFLHSFQNIFAVYSPGELFVDGTPLAAARRVVAEDAIKSSVGVEAQSVVSITGSIACGDRLSAREEVAALDNVVALGITAKSLTSQNGSIASFGRDVSASEIRAWGDEGVDAGGDWRMPEHLPEGAEVREYPERGVVLGGQLVAGLIAVAANINSEGKIWVPYGVVSAQNVSACHLYAEQLHAHGSVGLNGRGYLANGGTIGGVLRMGGWDASLTYKGVFRCGRIDLSEGGAVREVADDGVNAEPSLPFDSLFNLKDWGSRGELRHKADTWSRRPDKPR